MMSFVRYTDFLVARDCFAHGVGGLVPLINHVASRPSHAEIISSVVAFEVFKLV
eukprot:UN03013